MKTQELKQIEVSKIVPNKEQPREHFDTDKLKELAESIKSNGLINPIIIRKKGKGYEIVAGERRWRAHKLAKIKKINAFVRTYDKESEVAIESLIENLHRTDLTITEKGSFLLKIKEMEGLKTNSELARKVGLSNTDVSIALDSIDVAKKITGPVNYSQVSETKGLDEKDRLEVIKKSQKDDLGGRKLRELVKAVKNAKPEVKRALLNDDIDIKQAERISKISDDKVRETAIEQHKQIKQVAEKVESVVSAQAQSKKIDKKMQKQMVKASTYIAGFKSARIEATNKIEYALKSLMACMPYISLLDEAQQEKLEGELARFNEVLEKAEQLSEQIYQKL